MPRIFAQISPVTLDPQAALRFVSDEQAGAALSFVGQVRNHDEGRTVTSLEYTAHPEGQGFLEHLVQDFVQGRPEVYKVYAAHRIGSLRIGDAALVVALSTAHRGEAFQAMSDLVNRIKSEVPIWKQQFYPDASATWPGTN